MLKGMTITFANRPISIATKIQKHNMYADILLYTLILIVCPVENLTGSASLNKTGITNKH